MSENNIIVILDGIIKNVSDYYYHYDEKYDDCVDQKNVESCDKNMKKQKKKKIDYDDSNDVGRNVMIHNNKKQRKHKENNHNNYNNKKYRDVNKNHEKSRNYSYNYQNNKNNNNKIWVMKGSQEKDNDNDNDNGVDKNEIIVKNNNCNDSNAMTVKKHRHTRNGSTKRRLQLWNSIFSNNTTCFVCDVSISYHDYEAAHVIPLCKGGNNSFENLRICCKSCNKICGTKNLLEFKNEYRKINQNNYEKKEIPKFIAINNCVEKSRNSKSLRTLIFIFVCNLCRKISGFINYLKLLLSYNKKN